jgi:two-component system LytT family response regulator
MYKTVIIEDDTLAQEMVSDLLSAHPEYGIHGIFLNVKSSLKSLPLIAPDLVFLDMELPDGKGFDILEALPEINFDIIITTAHNSYMLQAIQHSALDYLLKPITAGDLAGALKRFEQKRKEITTTTAAHSNGNPNKIILSMNEELLFLDIADILRLESDGSYTHFYTMDKKKYTTSRTMATYEPKLLPHHFFRVHHSHLINLHHIDKYIKGEGGYVIMADGSHVEVSRRRKEEFLKALGY